jgi:hypothetical protein
VPLQGFPARQLVSAGVDIQFIGFVNQRDIRQQPVDS